MLLTVTRLSLSHARRSSISVSERCAWFSVASPGPAGNFMHEHDAWTAPRARARRADTAAAGAGTNPSAAGLRGAVACHRPRFFGINAASGFARRCGA